MLGVTFEQAREAMPRVNPALARKAEKWAADVRKILRERKAGAADERTA